MSSFFQEYGSEMISKVLNIFIFHSLHFYWGRYRCARWRLVNTFAQSSQYCHWFNKCLTNGSFVGFISFDDSNFGVGKTPAIIALFIYSLLPILRNTYIGMKNVDENYRDVAKGMGMTNLQSILVLNYPLPCQQLWPAFV